MEHKKFTVITIIGAVLAGLIAVGNVIYLMVLKAKSLSAEGANDIFSKVVEYPLSAKLHETVYAKISLWILGVIFLALTVMYIINFKSKKIRNAFIVIRGLQVGDIIAVTVMFNNGLRGYTCSAIALIALAVLEIPAFILMMKDGTFAAALLALTVSFFPVYLTNLVFFLIFLAGIVLLLVIFFAILGAFTGFDIPVIPVFTAAGKFVGYIQDRFD